MLTGHMQNVLPVFVNEDAWQSISEENREAILTALDDLAYETLETAPQAEKDLIATLTEKGMTFISEDSGLQLNEFRERVGAQVAQDFPSWAPYIEQSAAIE